jgi:hypothetical protein
LSQGDFNRPWDQGECDVRGKVAANIVEEADPSTFHLYRGVWPVCRATLKQLNENARVTDAPVRLQRPLRQGASHSVGGDPTPNVSETLLRQTIGRPDKTPS